MACNSKKLNIISIRNLIKMMRSRKYVVYNEPYKLNIVGIRKANTEPTKFDDTINVFFKNDNTYGNKYYLKTYAGLDQKQINKVLTKDTRYIIFNNRYPNYFITKKEIFTP